jgi:hypothetical protein
LDGVGLAPSRSVWVFLAGGCFAAKAPAYGPWIALDFLGFSRPNRDLSMGYADFSRRNFSRALPPLRETRRDGRRRSWAMRKRRIVHEASLAWFLIFCKILLSDRYCCPTRFEGIGDTLLNPQGRYAN